MESLTIDIIQKVYSRKGYIMTDFNIFGIRHFDNEDKFTDLKGIVRKINGAWELHTFNQTTKPGLEPLKDPLNSEGCGTLVEGQYLNMWVIGFHKGVNDVSHRALIQIPKPLPVYRDRERDGIIRYDADHIRLDGGGIDHHGTWVGKKIQGTADMAAHTEYSIVGNVSYPSVGPWSMACQVISPPKDQQTFMDMCIQANLKFHSYTLFKDTDFTL